MIHPYNSVIKHFAMQFFDKPVCLFCLTKVGIRHHKMLKIDLGMS